ncbi:unnamed protein product, partial [Iphiclides podalirius]
MAVSDAATEIEKMKILEQRIKAPSIWGRVPWGLRFEDLQDTRYEDAVKLLKKHYLNEEITYRSVKILQDKEGTDEFVHNVRIWMKDKMSIAAVKEGTDKLVGVLIMRIQEKSKSRRILSHIQPSKNHTQPALLKGLSRDMLKAAVALAYSANVPAIAGIFTTSRGQAVAEEIGFVKFNEIYYVRYLIDDQIAFFDTGLGNYGAAIMAYRIPDVYEPPEVQSQRSSRFNLQPMQNEDDD